MATEMGIPNDVRQFSLKHLLAIVLSISVSLGIMRYLPTFGLRILLAVSFFWAGMGLLLISDTVDHRPIDERNRISQLCNILGLLIVVFSLIGFAANIILSGALFVLWR